MRRRYWNWFWHFGFDNRFKERAYKFGLTLGFSIDSWYSRIEVDNPEKAYELCPRIWLLTFSLLIGTLEVRFEL